MNPKRLTKLKFNQFKYFALRVLEFHSKTLSFFIELIFILQEKALTQVS